ncbi:hypothetical protein [Candidatus Formimonas warabiya]|uniref:DUF7878 domain-containing protein n=1 Tax=Formimonas warabiya TaxID=1761012 RepID=A0A3G1KR72_FORW1|nr:hypothetical protein [Candidatus Formimonas warabiya]ATW24937.1 hypothetical protein DCMF_09275 [Candidatus Formimonas warabiya]
MDCIPNKIEIKFKIDLDKTIEHELVMTRNFKVLADIEGELAILINGRIFFYDQYILLMELGVALTKWLRTVKLGMVENFQYHTMDHDDGPILGFIQDQDGWRIISIWQKFDVGIKFDLHTLLNEVDKFLENIKNQLMNRYNIDMDIYI